MTKFTDHQLEKGRARFLDGHPTIKARIDGLSSTDAEHLGMTLDQLREIETMRELRAVAQMENIDSTELFWSCIADTAEEFGALLESRDRAIKRNLGL